MRQSEVFNEFIKIAQDKGLISKDAPEKAKNKLEKDPRWDSLDISAIEALYGVKPNAPKDMEYKRNIMEDAHPESVVVSPSYDKLNGLVENNNERQDIILNILNKTPNGQLTNHKYAEKELFMSLVRVGNDMDNKNNDQLRILADTCLSQLSNDTIKKRAAVLPLIAGAAALIGALYLQQHMPAVNEGFEKNHQKLMAELNDLLKASNSWGFGQEYSSNLKNMVNDFKNKIDSFHNLYEKVYPIIQDLQKPRTAQELAEMAQKPETDTVIKAYRTMRKMAEDMLPYVKTIVDNFSSETFKSQETKEKGFFTNVIDKTQVLHGGKGLIADDFDDVVLAIPPYQNSVTEMLKTLQKAESLEKKAADDLKETSVASTNMFGNKDSKDPEINDLNKQIVDLEKELKF